MDEKPSPELSPNTDEPEFHARNQGLVLVIDQSEGIRWTLREAFKTRGYATILAESLWASKTVLDHYRYTAILSGVTLPDGSGFDLLAAAKAVTPTTPVFLMSGVPYDAEHLRKLGAADFFQKPFNVMETIAAILSYRRLRAVDGASE